MDLKKKTTTFWRSCLTFEIIVNFAGLCLEGAELFHFKVNK